MPTGPRQNDIGVGLSFAVVAVVVVAAVAVVLRRRRLFRGRGGEIVGGRGDGEGGEYRAEYLSAEAGSTLGDERRLGGVKGGG